LIHCVNCDYHDLFEWLLTQISIDSKLREASEYCIYHGHAKYIQTLISQNKLPQDPWYWIIMSNTPHFKIVERQVIAVHLRVYGLKYFDPDKRFPITFVLFFKQAFMMDPHKFCQYMQIPSPWNIVHRAEQTRDHGSKNYKAAKLYWSTYIRSGGYYETRLQEAYVWLNSYLFRR
jgi:hypothetical protein